jgi:hypothetical protein
MKLTVRTLSQTLAGLFTAGLLTTSNVAQAQPIVAAHYPAGAEGIKAGSLPPPGVYFRDYNFFYNSDRFKNLPVDFGIFAYLNAPRVIWMTKLEVLGANYGMDVIVPFGYMNFQAAGRRDYYFGLGDIEVEPLLLGWHFKQFDLSCGYAFWAPTGDFSPTRPDLLAKGFWSHMLTLGGTWYADDAKTWAVSVLNRYEFCHKQDQTDLDPGQVYTIEWGVSKSLKKTIDVGVIGYYQQQTTEDHGDGSSNGLDRKIGVGPEISAFCTKLGVNTSVRYAYEFGARERPEGHLVSITLTKQF